MRAQAVVFTGPGVVEIDEVACPDPGPDDVVVSLHHSWISTGTESSQLRGERIAGDTARREGDPWPFPIVPGYQKVGRVEWVGDRISDIESDEIVFATVSRVEGMFTAYGGHVSPAVVPRTSIWRLPEATDPRAFAGLVLTQVGYNCGTRPPVEVGDAAVVLGDGLVGQWAAQTLAWRGAEVTLLGRHHDRLARFRTGGGHSVLNTSSEPPRPWLEGRHPEGVAVLVDTIGGIAAVEELVPCLRRHAHVVSAGFYGTEDRLAIQPLRDREISVDVVAGWEQRRMDATLQLIRGGHLTTLPLITHTFPVARAVEAWQMIVDRSQPFLGVVLDWQ